MKEQQPWCHEETGRRDRSPDPRPDRSTGLAQVGEFVRHHGGELVVVENREQRRRAGDASQMRIGNRIGHRERDFGDAPGLDAHGFGDRSDQVDEAFRRGIIHPDQTKHEMPAPDRERTQQESPDRQRHGHGQNPRGLNGVGRERDPKDGPEHHHADEDLRPRPMGSLGVGRHDGPIETQPRQ